jgi:5-oxoprolinase (ATP-hydrolysing)
MGKVLQKISISTNIRERLDFSCGLFDWNGKLLANAPHLPVHLGSMETAVTEQIKRGIQVGDVVLTNHPIAGGSHLPDLTVVTCSEI